MAHTVSMTHSFIFAALLSQGKNPSAKGGIVQLNPAKRDKFHE